MICDYAPSSKDWRLLYADQHPNQHRPADRQRTAPHRHPFHAPAGLGHAQIAARPAHHSNPKPGERVMDREKINEQIMDAMRAGFGPNKAADCLAAQLVGGVSRASGPLSNPAGVPDTHGASSADGRSSPSRPVCASFAGHNGATVTPATQAHRRELGKWLNQQTQKRQAAIAMAMASDFEQGCG